MSRYEKVDLAYEYLNSRERQREAFTIEQPEVSDRAEKQNGAQKIYQQLI